MSNLKVLAKQFLTAMQKATPEELEALKSDYDLMVAVGSMISLRSKWVKVSDRLPEQGVMCSVRYLDINDEPVVTFGFFDPIYSGDISTFNVQLGDFREFELLDATHWQPLSDAAL